MRLNPFAFPVDTDFRLALIVLAVIAGSLFSFQTLFMAFLAEPLEIETRMAQSIECMLAVPPAGSPGAIFDEADVLQSQEMLRQCREITRFIDWSMAAWFLAGFSLLLVTAAALFLLAPYWSMWRRRVVRLPEDEHGYTLRTQLLAVCQESGLSRLPEFRLRPTSQAISGQVFGHWGRYYLSLDGGLAACAHTRPGLFRAIILHELAHIRNGDVDKVYSATAAWWAFWIVAVGPFTLALPGEPLVFVWESAIQVGVLAALVLLTRSAILRVRESYADLRASTWEVETRSELRQALEGIPGPELGLFKRLLRYHPAPEARRRLLDDTRPFFQLGYWEVFAAGMALMMAFSYLKPALTTSGSLMLLLAYGLSFTVSGLALGVVGSGIWRAVFASIITGAPAPGVARPALALWSGMLAGAVVASDAMSILFFAQSGESGLEGFLPAIPARNAAAYVGFSGLWALLLGVALLIFLWWMIASARPWMELALRLRSPRPVYLVGLLMSSLMLSVVLGWLLVAQPSLSLITAVDYVERTWLSLWLPFLSFWVGPSGAGLLLAAWAIPMLVWVWRGAVRTNISTWASLDGPLSLPPAYSAPALNLPLAMAAGVAGALSLLPAALSGSLLAWVVTFLSSEVGVLVALVVLAALAVTGLLLTGVTAFAVALIARPYSWLKAVSAGWVASLITGFMLWASSLLLLLPLSAQLIFPWILFGLLVSAPAAWLGAAVPPGRSQPGIAVNTSPVDSVK